MSYFVVDTNVPIVANGDRSPQADDKCQLDCINELVKIRYEGHHLVLDNSMKIIHEYIGQRLSPSGRPGPGDAFMEWVWQNQCNQDICEQVIITEDINRGFIEFPDDCRLENFHKSDRKFVAVALQSRNNPVILNAVDPGWWIHKEVLKEYGVLIKFLCPKCLRL